MAEFPPNSGDLEIVLASDLGCRCDRALDRARALAAAWRARLRLVIAVEGDFHDPSWRSARHHLIEQAGADLAAEFQDDAIDWTLDVAAGDPAEVVMAAAAQSGARLIVTGVARNELMGRNDPGRMARTLMRRAPAPVLVVKRRPHDPYRRMMAPTDFSRASELAAAEAMRLFPDATLTLLHGYRVPFSGFISEPANQDEMREEALENLAEFRKRLQVRAGGREPLTALVEYGSVEELEADYVRSHAPDLVVLGAKRTGRFGGQGAADRLLLGARCDVLIVPEASQAAEAA